MVGVGSRPCDKQSVKESGLGALPTIAAGFYAVNLARQVSTGERIRSFFTCTAFTTASGWITWCTLSHVMGNAEGVSLHAFYTEIVAILLRTSM